MDQRFADSVLELLAICSKNSLQLLIIPFQRVLQVLSFRSNLIFMSAISCDACPCFITKS